MEFKEKAVVILIILILGTVTGVALVWSHELFLEHRMKEHISMRGFAIVVTICGAVSIENELLLFSAILDKYNRRNVLRFTFNALLFTLLLGGFAIIKAFDTSGNEAYLLSEITHTGEGTDSNSLIHHLQNEFQCCGITSNTDWIKNNKGYKCVNLLYEYNRCPLPDSCCNGVNKCTQDKAHDKGCLEEIDQFQKASALIFLYGVLALVLTQIASIFVLFKVKKNVADSQAQRPMPVVVPVNYNNRMPGIRHF